MNILNNLKFLDEKPGSLVIKNTEKQQILAFALKKGQLLKKHVSPIPATLVVVKGSVAFDMNNNVTELMELSTIEIPQDVPHEVKGLEESIFLVIKAK